MMMISYIIRMKTMRTLVDLGDTQVQAPDELSKREKRSRAALIRLAIDEYLAKRHSKQESDAFGLWGQTEGGWLGLSGKGAKRVVKALFDTNILIDYLNAVPEAHNRPNIRVSSPRTAKSRSRKTRVRQSRNSLLRRVSRWRGARLVRRTLTAAPRAVRIVCLAALVLAAFS